MAEAAFPHYFKDVRNLATVDVYRVREEIVALQRWVEMRKEDSSG